MTSQVPMQSVLNQALDHRYCVMAAFCVYFVLRAGLIFSIPIEFTTSDELRYFQGAVTIASGGSYNLYFPVGYSAFLAIPMYLIGPIATITQISNLLLACITFYFTLKLTKVLFGVERIARLAVILLAIYPNNIAYTGILLSENLLTPLVLAGTFYYIARPNLLFAGIAGMLFGLAALTKAQAILLPVGLVGFHFLAHRRQPSAVFMRAIVFTLLVGAIVAPWVVRNTLVFDELTFISTNGGSNLLIGNNPDATGAYSYVKRDSETSTFVDQSPGWQAVKWITDNPLEFAALIPKKIWHLWALDGDSEWTYQREYKRYNEFWQFFRTVRVFNQVFYLGILLTALLGSLSLRPSNSIWRPWCYLGAAFAGYVTIISTAFFGSPRFHFPVMPWLMMYSASWIVSVINSKSSEA